MAFYLLILVIVLILVSLIVELINYNIFHYSSYVITSVLLIYYQY